MTGADCGLRIGECGFSDCGFAIEIVDWRLRLSIVERDCRLRPTIDTPQSQSTLGNHNPQSAINQIRNLQSTIDNW